MVSGDEALVREVLEVGIVWQLSWVN